MGPTWVLPAPDGPHRGPMNLAIRVYVMNLPFTETFAKGSLTLSTQPLKAGDGYIMHDTENSKCYEHRLIWNTFDASFDAQTRTGITTPNILQMGDH